MKIHIQLQDPDGVYDSVTNAIEETLDGTLSEKEAELIVESRRTEVMEKLKKWLTHGEILSLVIDTEAETATVKESK